LDSSLPLSKKNPGLPFQAAGIGSKRDATNKHNYNFAGGLCQLPLEWRARFGKDRGVAPGEKSALSFTGLGWSLTPVSICDQIPPDH
jgi:hypothetical protein